MRNSINLLAGVWVATCCATTVQAQVPTDDLFELSLEELMGMEVEIATGTKKSLSKAPAVVTLITADDLKKTGYTNVIEALEMVPGIHVRFNRMGYSPFIHFRGTNTNQTLLMVNGQSMRSHASAWPQDQFWKGLPVSAVERIEVVRGPGSALYEANASAGVINIITKSAGTIDESEAGIRVGEFNTQEAWIQHGAQWNGYDVGMTAELMSTDGHDPSFTEKPSNYPTNGTRVLDLGWKNADLRGYLTSNTWRMQVDYMRQSEVKIGLNGEYFDDTAAGDTERLNLAWLFKDQQYSSEWGLDADIRYQKLKYDSGDGYNDNNDVTNLNQEGASEQLLKTEVSGLFNGFSGHSVRIGGGVSYEEIYDIMDLDNGVADTSPFVTAHSRTTQSIFLQDVWQINEQWELTAGNRWDHYNDFGNTSNARIALVWQRSDELVTKLMYGEGFRPLTFREIDDPHDSNTPTGLPEKTQTYELAFTWKASEKLTLGSNFFVFDIENMSRQGSTGDWSGEDFRTRGVELEGTWQPREDLRISGNITARNPDHNGSRKDYEPNKDAYLRMDWKFKPEWNLNLQSNWIAGRERKDVDGSSDDRSDMDNNFIVDSTIRYSGLKEWELAASIRNLFDDDAMEHTGGETRSDLALPERNLFLEARYKF